MDDHFVGKIAVKAIISHAGKVLLTRGRGDVAIWEIPGGRLHKGEMPEETLRREIREELGQEVCVGRFVYAQPYIQARDGVESFLMVYEVAAADPEMRSALASGEIAEFIWIDRGTLDHQEIYENCRNALLAYYSQ
jgi:8-oxo-dGTP diphosphatase